MSASTKATQASDKGNLSTSFDYLKEQKWIYSIGSNNEQNK